jgi:hypothetical protein
VDWLDKKHCVVNDLLVLMMLQKMRLFYTPRTCRFAASLLYNRCLLGCRDVRCCYLRNCCRCVCDRNLRGRSFRGRGLASLRRLRLYLKIAVAGLKVFSPITQRLAVQVCYSPDLQVRLRIVHADHAYCLLQPAPDLDGRCLSTKQLSSLVYQLVRRKASGRVLGLVRLTVPLASLQAQKMLEHAVRQCVFELDTVDIGSLFPVLLVPTLALLRSISRAVSRAAFLSITPSKIGTAPAPD